MKFTEIKPAQIIETPAIGDIIEVDYIERGILPDNFTEGGHRRGRYICMVIGYTGYSLDRVRLKVLYDMTQNRPFSAKNRDLYIGPREWKGKEYYGTGSGATAFKSWFTRREVNLMIDEYNKRKREA